jgi:hypothetical protein
MLTGIVSLAGSAQAQTASATAGTATLVLQGTVNLQTLPKISAPGANKPAMIPLRTGVDPTTYAARKARAAGLSATPGGAAGNPAIPQRSGVETPMASTSFTSASMFNCANLNGFGYAPADQALAVGAGSAAGVPSVLQVVNNCLQVFDKAGALVAGPVATSTFFGFAPAGAGINYEMSDPRVLYDWINHRYIFVMIYVDLTGTAASFYNIAVSTADDPSGTYCLYTGKGPFSVTPGAGVLPDFPRLGQDRQNIYIGSNIFTGAAYKWEEVFALQKSQVYSCAATPAVAFQFDLKVNGTATDTTQPANVYSAGDQPRTEFMVTSFNINFGGGQCSSGCNGLVVWGWYDPFNTTGSGNLLNGVVVPTTNNYFLPPNADQPGASGSIDTGDVRISGSVVYSAGRLFPSLTTNASGKPACLLYNLSPGVNPSDGTVTGATIHSERLLYQGTYYCTQQPDPEGNVTTVFSFSDLSNFPGLVYISRRVSLPSAKPFPDNGFFLIKGAGFYKFGRWGDYTATSIAGLVSGGGTGGFPTFWFAGMYALGDANQSWGTAIGKNGYTNISQP